MVSSTSTERTKLQTVIDAISIELQELEKEYSHYKDMLSHLNDKEEDCEESPSSVAPTYGNSDIITELVQIKRNLEKLHLKFCYLRLHTEV